MTMSEWRDSIRPWARMSASSSMITASNRKSPAAPPYSSGVQAPRKPASPQRRQTAGSLRPAAFQAPIWGAISDAAKRRNWELKSSCSSLKTSRRIPASLPGDSIRESRRGRALQPPHHAHAEERGEASEEDHGSPASEGRRQRAAVGERGRE